MAWRGVARAALAAFGLAGAEPVPIRDTHNTVFAVRAPDGARYALRVHRPGYRTAAQTRAELELLVVLSERLAGSRVTVPRPLAARDGTLVVEVADEDGSRRHCSLLGWVDGRELRPGRRRGLGPAAAHLLGEALALVHDAASRSAPESAASLPSWDAETLLTTASPFRPGPIEELLTPDEQRIVARVVDEGFAVFERLREEGAEWGVLHGDYIPGNCRFTRGRAGWRVGVLDFDDAGHGFRAYDVAVLLDHFHDEPGCLPLARAYLDGYRSVRPLPTALERHFPVLMAVRHISVCLWLAGAVRAGLAPVDPRRFLAVRTGEMARRLALAGRTPG